MAQSSFLYSVENSEHIGKFDKLCSLAAAFLFGLWLSHAVHILKCVFCPCGGHRLVKGSRLHAAPAQITRLNFKVVLLRNVSFLLWACVFVYLCFAGLWIGRMCMNCRNVVLSSCGNCPDITVMVDWRSSYISRSALLVPTSIPCFSTTEPWKLSFKFLTYVSFSLLTCLSFGVITIVSLCVCVVCVRAVTVQEAWGGVFAGCGRHGACL